MRGDQLQVALPIHPAVRALLTDHLGHRYRLLQARGPRFLLPLDMVLTKDTLTLRYRDAQQLAQAQHAPRRPRLTDPEALLALRLEEILPVVETHAEGHAEGVAGFAPLFPVAGRLLPPVSFFVPLSDADLATGKAADLAHLATWIAGCAADAGVARDDLFFRDLRGTLALRDSAALGLWVEAERERTRHLLGIGRPSFLDLLTEAELLEFVARTYPYRVRRRGADLWLELDLKTQDPHFPELVRLPPQELWDELTEETQATPELTASAQCPDPLRPMDEGVAVRWVGVHPSEPLICVELMDPRGPRLPDQGYLVTTQPGDYAVIVRKRVFSHFAGAHQALAPILHQDGAASAAPPPLARVDLDAAILATRGVFTVQGPPGTGKTYLATQVVRQRLQQQPGARILVCAKEHFALNHILKTLTAALRAEGLAFRGYRALSPARLRKIEESGEERPPFTPEEVARELAQLPFAESAQALHTQVEASPRDQDLRCRSLARAGANLFFCTTLDAALVDLIGQTGFDLVIIEEAGKCYPSEVLHAAVLGRCALLIGDQNQLPPYQEERTRRAVDAWSAAIARAVADPAFRASLIDRFGPAAARLVQWQGDGAAHLGWLRTFQTLYQRLPTRFMLNEQYRMERPLSDLVGAVFYGAPFVHKKTEASPLAGRLPAALDVPLLWLCTPHASAAPQAAEDGALRRSRYELAVVLGYLRRIPDGPPIDLVLLTPYNAHKDLLIESEAIDKQCRRLGGLPAAKLVRTTDEYQGREAELTVLSLVRNNQQGRRAWGFMTQPERLNVMFSRARYRQVVVGCAEHARKNANEAPYLRSVLAVYERTAQANAQAARLLLAQEFYADGR